jgi:hypothetical protein
VFIDFPIIIPEIAAIPLDLPLRPLHAHGTMDPGEIPGVLELIDAFQRDIPGGESFVTSIIDGLQH